MPPVPEPDNVITPPLSESKHLASRWWLAGLAIVLLAIFGVVFAWQSGFLFPNQKAVPSPSDNEANNTFSSSTPLTLATGCDANAVYASSLAATTTVQVEWSVPKPIDGLRLISETGDWGSYATSTKYYAVGQVSSGVYTGANVILVIIPNVGIYHFLEQSGKLTLLAKDSDITGITYTGAPKSVIFSDKLNCNNFSVDGSLDLSGLNFPDSFSYQGATFALANSDTTFDPFGGSVLMSKFGLNYSVGLLTLNTADTDNNRNGFDVTYSSLFGDYTKQFKVAFTDPVLGPVYTDNRYSNDFYTVGYPNLVQNAFYVPAPDGTFREYTENFPVTYGNYNNTDITWNDNSTTTGDYIPADDGGCGYDDQAIVIGGFTKADLTPIGRLANGDSVYTFSNSNNPVLQYLYQFEATADGYQGISPPSYSDWLKQKLC